MAWNKNTEKKVLMGVDALLLALVAFLFLKCNKTEHHGSYFKEFVQVDTLNSTHAKEKYGAFVPPTDSVAGVDSLGMKGDINCMDIVMCIDVTGSMSGILSTVKSQALNFYPDIKKACTAQGKNVLGMRIKVIAFRDYHDKTSVAMHETPFYNIPDQKSKFRSYVNSLVPVNGGDDPENALEAIALAIKSNWTHSAGRQRHVILLWTDAPTHPIGKAKGICPNSIPSTFSGLTSLWNGGNISQTGKCLIVFAPKDKSWNGIRYNWDNTFFKTSRPGGGLSDVDYKQIINTIAESV